jgi:hypothetical protein
MKRTTVQLRTMFVAASLFAFAPVLGAQRPADSASALPKAGKEQRVRERVATVVQNRLQLSDEQMRKLRDVNAKYEPRRRTLFADERDARVTLRTQLQRGKEGDQTAISSAIDKMLKTQRARLDIAEQEQRDLSAFMTPAQRAGYLALQEQIRRRVDEMRRGRGARGAMPRP